MAIEVLDAEEAVGVGDGAALREAALQVLLILDEGAAQMAAEEYVESFGSMVA